jgi:ribosomal 50S subunit-recycling heat shock protein
VRIDLTLKYLCLVKSRSLAKTLCNRNLILVDGKPVRPAAVVSAGVRITIHFARGTHTVELLSVPEKQLSKSAALDYYQRVDTPHTDSRPGDGDGVPDDFFDHT